MNQTDPRRLVPRTDTVLAEPALVAAAQRLGADRVKAAVLQAQDACRQGEIGPDQVVAYAVAELPAGASSLRRVLNATGIVVHTNLGRAPLSSAAVEAITVAAGATDVELDLATGRRGRRGRTALAALAAACPEAEAVHVVNNGAAALALACCALAAGREVLIARGELVEIGDGFRIPELVESVGARLREVGTTNRVHLRDYAAALEAGGDAVAMILKVHPSNFVVSGFTSTVGVGELSTLGLPVVADIGSGLLSDHPRLPDEPSATAALRAGASLVTASGDKLLGGPQTGLLLGRAELVERLRRHPLARALRVDKLTLAALEATLSGPTPPVAAALATDPADLLARARALAADLSDLGVEAVDSTGAVGGGGAPGVELPSAALACPAAWAEPLRLDAELPVVGHLFEGRLLLDLIALDPADDGALTAAVRRGAAPV